MRRSRWFILGVGVGVVGARRLRVIARPVLERSVEQTSRRAVARMQGDLRTAVREAIATYRDQSGIKNGKKNRVLEGEAREIHGL
ncbi:hypothetical protein [Ferrimicrobium sp.]|uniref:hypothetical protein n=1 Tax=Ferrimicrobium sp. TaxID=2926050 RepID=UPI00263207D6|nr:hypothetical protein [Ferrimicrobium sp.]